MVWAEIFWWKILRKNYVIVTRGFWWKKKKKEWTSICSVQFLTITGGCGRILCWEYAFWSSHKNLFKFGRAKCICEITICTCSEESFLILYLAAKISREPPEQLGAVPYPQADQTPAQNVSMKCGMGRAFPRRGRFQPYGWTCEWHKIDVIILSKSTDSISRDWATVFTTAFASQAKFRGGGAVRLFAINFEWCWSLNTSLVWMRFALCILWTVTALIFLLQRRNHPRQNFSSHLPHSLIFGKAAAAACQLSVQIGCVS